MSVSQHHLRRRILRLDALFWSARHAHIYLGSKRLEMELAELSRRSQVALENVESDVRPWIISSAIVTQETALSYTNVRSVFTPKERFEQTKKTVESIQALPSGSGILLVDATMNGNGLNDLFSSNPGVFVVEISDLPFLKLACQSPLKGLGEALTVLGVTQAPYIRQSGFWKISGRYSLANDCLAAFNEHPEGITAVISNGSMNTTCYSVAPKSVNAFRFALRKTVRRLLLGVALEGALGQEFRGNRDLQSVDRIGIEGLIAVNGQKFTM